MAQENHDSSQTVIRAFQVLDEFTTGEKELGVRELSRRMGLPKSTIHRLLSSLQAVGALEKNPETDKYYLGLKLFELGSVVAAHRGFQDRARQHLEALVAATGETAHLAVLDSDGYALVVDKVASTRTVMVGGAIGVRRPIYCSAIGKSLTAYLSDDELHALIEQRPLVARTSQTITDVEHLKRELAQVRKQGYSVDNEEYEEGLRCLAAPVFDERGRVMAVIGISGPLQRLNLETLPKLAQLVKDEAHKMSRALGHSLLSVDGLERR